MSERPIKVKLSAQVAEYNQAMLSAAKSTREVGSETEKLQQKREAFNLIGTSALAAGSMMLAGTALSVKAAMDWESAWTGVTKTVEGTPEQLAAVESGLRGLTSVLPASHDEIAAVAEAAGQLGVETGSIVSFTRTMIDLGETTNLSANEAATSLARFMNIMGTSQADVSNLGSALVGLGNNFATSESEILEMSTRLSKSGVQIGLSEGEVLGLAASLSSVGIEAEAGGSAMSKVMIDIAASVDEGGDRVEKFAKVAGVSAQEFSEQWKTDPGAALAAFVKGLANAESQGQTTLGVLADLGITEVRMRDALLGSSAAADDFAEAMAMGNDEFEKGNALVEEAAKRYETVESKLAIAGNAVRDAAIDVGQVFLPMVGEAAEKVTDFAQRLGAMPEPVQGLVGIVTGLGGAALAAGGLFLLAVPKVAEYRAAIQNLGTTTQRTSRVIGTMSRVAGAVAVFAIAAEAVNSFGDAIADSIGPSAAEVQSKMTLATSGVEMFYAALQKRDAPVSSIEAAVPLFGEVAGALDDAADQADEWWNAIAPANRDTLSTLYAMGEELETIAQTDISAASAQFRQFAEDAELTERQTVQAIREMPGFRDALIKAAEAAGIASDDTSLLNFVMEEVPDSAGVAAEGMSEMEGAAAEADQALSDVVTALADVARGALDMGDAKDSALSALNGMRDAAEDEESALDGVNDASIRLRDSAREVEQAHRDSAQAIIDNGGTLEEAQAEWAKGRDAVLEMLEAKGLDIEQAKAWADENLGSASEVTAALADVKNAVEDIPPSKNVDITLSGAAVAISTIQAVNAELSNLPQYKGITVGVNGGVDGLKTNEDGGLYTYSAFANGGIPSSVDSGIYGSGPALYKWREPNLPWEAFISPKPDQRERNHGVWIETGERLGFLKDAPQAQAESGPLVGSLTIQSSGNVKSDLEEVNFLLRAIGRGGNGGR